MIRLTDVSKTYSKGRVDVQALRAVTLRVPESSFATVSGPSGSGKTTLLNMIGLLDDPSSGTIRLLDHDLSSLDRRERARFRGRTIGFVFQSFNLISTLTAWRNVALPLKYAGIARTKRRRRALDALGAVGLADRVDHLPAELSGGEEQRVAIARSLVIEPKLLLADEPTGNLDTESGHEIMRQFAGLHENGATILIVTHDPLVTPYADRHVTMRDGRIVTDDDPARGT